MINLGKAGSEVAASAGNKVIDFIAKYIISLVICIAISAGICYVLNIKFPEADFFSTEETVADVIQKDIQKGATIDENATLEKIIMNGFGWMPVGYLFILVIALLLQGFYLFFSSATSLGGLFSVPGLGLALAAAAGAAYGLIMLFVFAYAAGFIRGFM